MAKTVSIGNQSFESIRRQDIFYIDKSEFIKEWWENEDVVTLITRPRRFGKTLNMDMLNCFFSNKFTDRGDLFEGLEIWKEEKYRKLQGTYPVIFISFAAVKGDTFEITKQQIVTQIVHLFEEKRFLLDADVMSESEKIKYKQFVLEPEKFDISAKLNELSDYLSRYYNKKVIILLDEYDTPMQEAYVYGFWKDIVSFMRSLFNATFKTNPYLERAVMTGITRVSKESIFSDLNNLKVVTTTSDEYADCFGFTEKEVFDALDEADMSKEKTKVKEWYDGFTFGIVKDIYNPWSITNYLKTGKFSAYWADTSSNGLVNKLIQTAPAETKELIEQLLKGESIEVKFDEQIVFEQLDKSHDAIWSLLVASGYLKIDYVEYKGLLLNPWYHISITNFETLSMFANMFSGWFESSDARYNDFIKALLRGNIKEMNYYMNKVALATFSYFDTGKRPSEISEPEKFYHGFVLGLIVELSDKYEVKSNRESGFGRYDVMIVPFDKKEDAMVLEFKVYDSDEENSLEDTLSSALKQINEKEYDAELLSRGFAKEKIRHYGFVFKGKKVLIGS
ncbi:MAG: ATP-binding protein [Clostridium sp.]|uniref:AAA family ATPase n=1 Tax=Butyribacter sp. TaxID=2822465 RepID=UPI002A9778CD|nr:ATP-binding protein [Clostridium sp.]MDY5180638.1 AAA family ATPase [Butyribacter sp.]